MTSCRKLKSQKIEMVFLFCDESNYETTMPAIYAVTNINTYPRGNMYLLTKRTAEWACMDLSRKMDGEMEFAVQKKYVKKDSAAMKRAEKTEEEMHPRMTAEYELGDWTAKQLKLWREGKLEAEKAAKLAETFQKINGKTMEQVAQEYGV